MAPFIESCGQTNDGGKTTTNDDVTLSQKFTKLESAQIHQIQSTTFRAHSAFNGIVVQTHGRRPIRNGIITISQIDTISHHINDNNNDGN